MAPEKKVITGSLGGAFTIIIVWALKDFAGVDVPTEVAQAFTILTGFGVAYLVSAD